MSGDFRKIVQGVNDTLDAVIGPLNVAAEHIDRISKGDTPQLITDEYKGDFNEIKNNLNQCIGTLNTLVDETGLIIKAAVEGKLANRADTEKVQGVYKKILRGFNDTLDAVVGPLNVSAEYVDRISKGDIPSKITDIYNGDFNEIKNNLNQLIDVANNLLKETDVLVAASNEGKLDTRGNADQFAGGWRSSTRESTPCWMPYCFRSAKATGFWPRYPTAKSTNSSARPTKATTKK